MSRASERQALRAILASVTRDLERRQDVFEELVASENPANATLDLVTTFANLFAVSLTTQFGSTEKAANFVRLALANVALEEMQERT